MWLILVDRSASMGDQFAGIVDGIDGVAGRPSRLQAVVDQLQARGEALDGAQLMFFTTPDLNWPEYDIEGGFDGAAPDAVGTADLTGALNWASEQTVGLEPTTDVHVLLLTDLRTTQDSAELSVAADALLRTATVHIILVDPSYTTLSLATAIAPGRVLLAASGPTLGSTLAALFPGPGRILPAADGPEPPSFPPAARAMPEGPQPGELEPVLPEPPARFLPDDLEPGSFDSLRDGLVGRAMGVFGRRTRNKRSDRPAEEADRSEIVESPEVVSP